MMITRILCLTLLLAWGVAIPSLKAQQVQLTQPFHTINDSFYENWGIGWGVDPVRRPDGSGWFYQGMPAGSTPPQFGGYDPAADARLGFRIGPFNFNMLAGQGSERSHVMQAPTIVIPNGGTGSLFDGSVRPFVTGVIPVVGAGAYMPPAAPVPLSPVREALARLEAEKAMQRQAAQRAAMEPPVVPEDPDFNVNDFAAEEIPAPLPAPARAAAVDDSPLVMRAGPAEPPAASGGGSWGDAENSTANHGDISVAEIRARQAAEQAKIDQEIAVQIEKARGYEQAGKIGIAKIYYKQAASRAEGELQQQLLAKLQSLEE